MDTKERQDLIQQLGSSDFWKQIEAAYDLAYSSDPDAFETVVNALEHPDDFHSEVISMMVSGLTEGAPQTLEPVIAHLEKSPFSPGGSSCAMVLGEIGYHQGLDRDPRIVPALLQALKVTLSEGAWSASAAVSALRQCVWAGPLPEAVAPICEVLKTASEESNPDYNTVDEALEILYAYKGDTLLEELRTEISGAPPPYRGILQDFIEKKEEEKKEQDSKAN